MFEEGDTVALFGKRRGMLPHEFRDHEYFKIVDMGVPKTIRYVDKKNEPRRTIIQPSTRRGVVASDAPRIRVALSWLDPAFCLSEEADDEEIEQYEDYSPDTKEHRIAVSMWYGDSPVLP